MELGIPGTRDWTKIQFGIRETLTGYVLCLLPEKRNSSKFGHGRETGKENDIRESDDRSSGYGIVIKT